MYKVAVRRNFIAQHFLFGGDWGAENKLHSHNYIIEVQLEGFELDEHGYLVDIADIENRIDTLVSYFQDRTLNELPEFQGLNPSIEHFARIFCHSFNEGLNTKNLIASTVIIWENDIAWASFRQEF